MRSGLTLELTGGAARTTRHHHHRQLHTTTATAYGQDGTVRSNEWFGGMSPTVRRVRTPDQ